MDQGDLTMNNKLDKYKQYVTDKLKHINRLLPKYATGDFSELVPIVESEDEFTELYTGINLMVEDIQERNLEREGIITELQKTEASARLSAEKYRTLFQNMNEGFAYHQIVTDKKGKPTDFIYLEVNKKFEEITGLKNEIILNKCATKVIPGIKKAKHDIISLYGEVAQTGKEKSFEIFNEPIEKWLMVRVFSPKKGYFVTMIDDITERKNTDNDLKTLLKKLNEEKNISKSVIESLPGVFYMFNQKGKFVNWNKNFETVTEYSNDEVLKSSPLNYFTGETKKKLAVKILTVFTKGEATVEGELLTKSGKHIPHYFTGKRVKINNQYFLLGVGLDISDKKEAEVRLREAMEELKRSNKELEEFAYVASHDLQEPLRMVSSYTQLLEKRYGDKLDTDAKEFIQFAVDGASRMQGLIQDLLNYSRITTKGQDFKKVSTNYALGKAITNLKDMIQQSQAVLVFNDELPTVMADEMQLMRVFQNLIGNGIKFAGEQPPQINISAEEKNGEWLFSVKDNGIGIEAEFKDRIFVIFQRLHGREKYPGTGIGLSICKRIIERHKGKIWVESKPGKGANFYFTLPRIK